MATIGDGLRVIDMGQGFAPSLAAMILADNGAEVIRIEPPGGDPARSQPAWILWNRGKKSLVLDLDDAKDRERAAALAATADVLIEDRGAEAMERLGLGAVALAARNPRLLYGSVTAFGSKGPHRGLPAYEGVVQAKGGGYTALAAWMGREQPTYRARPDASYATGNLLLQAIFAGLRVRLQTGLGQHIETSLYQGLTAYESGSYEPEQKRLKLIPGESPATIARPHMLLTYLVGRTRDGYWVQTTNNTARLYPPFLKALGLGHIYEDERYKGAPLSFKTDEDRLALRSMILEKMSQLTLDELMAIFLRDGLAGDVYLTTQQFLDHPQTIENQGVVEIDDPRHGRVKQLGTIVRYEHSRQTIGRAAPGVGDHTAEILASLAKPASAEKLSPPGNAPERPLAGITILDFASWLAAPFGTSLLADLGARVIKIEALTGDEFRSRGGGRGRSLQGKESLCIDLKNQAAQAIMHKLVARADAIVHNMRGDAASRLGIDLATVRRINPRIIYHYAGSYGSTGPGAGRAAFHPTAGALAGGALWQLGRGNEPPPPDEPLGVEQIDLWSRRVSAGNEGSPDVSAALAVASALAMAIYHRERTGVPQCIETTMLVSNAYVCSDDALRYAGKPPRAEPDRELRGLHALCRLYRSADGWVFLECRSEREWRELCEAIGRPKLFDDPRFRTPEARRAQDSALIALLGPVFSAATSADWEAKLVGRGVACVRADQVAGDFFLTDEAVRQNGLIVRTEHPVTGVFYRQGPPAAFSRTATSVDGAHLLGEDSESILRELGVEAGEIAKLKAAGVIRMP